MVAGSSIEPGEGAPVGLTRPVVVGAAGVDGVDGVGWGRAAGSGPLHADSTRSEAAAAVPRSARPRVTTPG